LCKKGRYLVHGENEFDIPPLSFALSDAVFSPGALCLSEPKNALHPREEAGGIRLIDLATAEPQWYLDLHSSHLTFNLSDQRFYCVALADRASPSHSLIRLASSLLECEPVLELGRSWGEFTPSGRVLVTAQGDVYQTSTGALLSHLDFPQRVYPDRPLRE
jgi:hypothetical protein